LLVPRARGAAVDGRDERNVPDLRGGKEFHQSASEECGGETCALQAHSVQSRTEETCRREDGSRLRRLSSPRQHQMCSRVVVEKQHGAIVGKP
jgi:hypothetical protein